MGSKKYAYYIKGTKVAIAEQTLVSTGGGFTAVAHCTLSGYDTKDTCEAAGGQWIPGSSGMTRSTGEYRSPETSISNGIEIEYTYAPTYNLQSTGTEGTDFHRFLGWGSDGTNLLLFTYGASDVSDLSSLFAANDWIYIEGSGRWSGLHQVKSTGGSTGILTLKTKCNIPAAKLSTTVNFTTNETITGQTTAHKMDIEAYKDATENRSTRYIFIDLADKAVNGGLFSLSSNTTSGVLTSSNKYTIDADGDYTETAAAMEVETSANDPVVIYNAFYEQISIYEGVEALEDESFELDLPRNLSNAIVYYVRAKNAEDKGDYEGKEYFMREYKKMVEKHNSAKSRSIHIAQGNREIIR